MAKVDDTARAGALRLLAGVRDGLRLTDQNAALARLAPGDRARAARLAAAVLRNAARADAVLAQHIDRRPRSEIADILRLAVVEMLDLGEAPHGVVNAAVALARGAGPKGRAASGMVNAVLRKASGFQGWADLPVPRLPDWLRAPMLTAYGQAAVQAIEAAHLAGAPLDFTAKPGGTAPGEALPTGSFRLTTPAQVSVLPGYAAGDWWVQDAAAALAARMLDVQPGEAVVDLCAAPGGKTLQLAAAGAGVTAVDLSPQRMERVAENLARCGLTARLVTADALDWHPDAAPDAVLLDAPCSATGTIRRHPDLPFLRDGAGIADLAALQSQLIDRALAMLRPGGRLVYATCSLLPDEGEAQIAAALTRHPGVTLHRPDLPGVAAQWWGDHGLRLRPDYWPERGGMDGFFIARLHKPV